MLISIIALIFAALYSSLIFHHPGHYVPSALVSTSVGHGSLLGKVTQTFIPEGCEFVPA